MNLCTDVCSTLLSKYGQIYPILCDVFACVLGEGDLFSKVLDAVTPDLDPVLWCMGLDVCPRGHGDGAISNVVVSPQEVADLGFRGSCSLLYPFLKKDSGKRVNLSFPSVPARLTGP